MPGADGMMSAKKPHRKDLVATCRLALMSSLIYSYIIVWVENFNKCRYSKNSAVPQKPNPQSNCIRLSQANQCQPANGFLTRWGPEGGLV